ncbi:MAG: Guanosine-diphosphatase [Chaenotheca gracillima]|nr:MAG: Guanosine-diphosphatase [Chaenotheca gracillima]
MATDRNRKRRLDEDTAELDQLVPIMTEKRRKSSHDGMQAALHINALRANESQDSSDSTTTSPSSTCSDDTIPDMGGADETSSEGSMSSSSSESSDRSSMGSTPSNAAPISTIPGPEVVTVPGRPKPHITSVRRASQKGGDEGGILSRLSTFLPAMAAANSTLEEERDAGTLYQRNIEQISEDDEEIDDESEEEGKQQRKQYIEMNLGLGVLEEKDPSDLSSSSNSSSSSSGSDYESEGDDPDIEILDAVPDTETPINSHKPHRSKKSAEPDILSRLMGRRRRPQQRSKDPTVIPGEANGEVDPSTPLPPTIEELS